MPKVMYQDTEYDITEEEDDALADYGADVAAGELTSKQALFFVLSKRFRVPLPPGYQPEEMAIEYLGSIYPITFQEDKDIWFLWDSVDNLPLNEAAYKIMSRDGRILPKYK